MGCLSEKLVVGQTFTEKGKWDVNIPVKGRTSDAGNRPEPG